MKLEGANELKKRLNGMADRSKLKEIVKSNGALLQQRMMLKTPVDTGTLRRSEVLSFEDNGLTAVVTASTNYAAYVEYGTRYMLAQPYARPALHEVKPHFTEDIKKVIK